MVGDSKGMGKGVFVVFENFRIKLCAGFMNFKVIWRKIIIRSFEKFFKEVKRS